MSDQSSSQPKQLAMAPSGVAALILGITASCVGWSFGIPGIIVGAIGMNISKKARMIFDSNPGKYRGEKFITQGMKWSRIGLIQGIILTVFWVLYYVFIIGLATSRFY